MQKYLAFRLLLFVPTLVIASIIIFGVMRVLPGDVALVVLSGSGEVTHNIEQIESVREELGLDAPLVVQYGKWFGSMLSGGFGGRSLETREELRSLVARQFPVTLQLTFYTILISVGISLPLGILAAVRQDHWLDYLVRVLSIAGQALPSFFIALVSVLGLVKVLHWSPPIIYSDLWEDPWAHIQMMLLPTLVLVWGYSAFLIRMTRSGMLEVLRQDYIRTAYNKGLAWHVVLFRHGLRNALIPVASVAGLQIGALLSGAVILESIFGLPGLGRGIVQAVTVRDYPVIQSLAMLLVFLMLSVNLAVDLIYSLVDPRISYNDDAMRASG